jgi:hypothetical protein
MMMRIGSFMGCGMNLAARFFVFCLVGAAGLSQNRASPVALPNARRPVPGSTTVAGYRLSADARAILGASGQVLIRLPSRDRKAMPELLGMLQHGADIEVFLCWNSPRDNGLVTPNLEIFRGRRGTEAALVNDFELDGGPFWHISFFQPPDAKDTPKVLIDTFVGTTYWTTYLLAPDRQSVEMLFASTGYEFADLDRDGIYELIAFDRRWSDSSWCLDLFGFDLYPRIFVRDGAGYRMAWPPLDEDAGAANFRVAAFAGLLGRGATELLVLQDRKGDELTTQALAIYRLEKGAFRPVAEAPLPADRIAFREVGIRNAASGGKEIVIRTATPMALRTGGAIVDCNPEGPGTAKTTYILRSDGLKPAQR